MKRSVIIIIGLIILVVSVAFYLAYNQKPDVMGADVTTNDGKMAEDFELVSLAGEIVSLEQLDGERVYVKFWASWCSICLAGMDELSTLSAEATDYKVITIVSPGYNGEMKKEDFIKWFEGLGYDNIEVLLDENGTIAKSYGVRAYPTSAYIGSDGVLVKILPGHTDNATINETFEKIY
ncbi:MAG: redoxin domain-containing protein [Clostridia bacterium]|nr:redoxin domain-containing protein [Clostridia bacterium]